MAAKKAPRRPTLPPESDPKIIGSYKKAFNSWLLSKDRMRLAAERRQSRKVPGYAGGIGLAVVVILNVDWAGLWNALNVFS